MLAARLRAEGVVGASPTTPSPRSGRPLLDPRVELATRAEALDDADAAVIVTEWGEFPRWTSNRPRAI